MRIVYEKSLFSAVVVLVASGMIGSALSPTFATSSVSTGLVPVFGILISGLCAWFAHPHLAGTADRSAYQPLSKAPYLKTWLIPLVSYFLLSVLHALSYANDVTAEVHVLNGELAAAASTVADYGVFFLFSAFLLAAAVNSWNKATERSGEGDVLGCHDGRIGGPVPRPFAGRSAQRFRSERIGGAFCHHPLLHHIARRCGAVPHLPKPIVASTIVRVVLFRSLRRRESAGLYHIPAVHRLVRTSLTARGAHGQHARAARNVGGHAPVPHQALSRQCPQAAVFGGYARSRRRAHIGSEGCAGRGLQSRSRRIRADEARARHPSPARFRPQREAHRRNAVHIRANRADTQPEHVPQTRCAQPSDGNRSRRRAHGYRPASSLFPNERSTFTSASSGR